MTEPMSDDADASAASELARLDSEIGVLAARVDQARQAWASADSILRATRLRRDEVARRLPITAAAPSAPSPRPAPEPAGGVAARVPETTTRTVQNVLFILGGLLLGTAAIVFTAVAWATFGVTGRATILAVVTALALGTPLLALRRGLRATAETFALLGLLLVILDGYAAWYVDLLGVRALPATRYAGLVCAVTAAVAAGYRILTRLVGPAFAAVVAAQPVLALVVAEWQPDAAGWAMVWAGTALVNLVVVRRGLRRSNVRIGMAVRVTGWILFAIALATAAFAALIAQVDAGDGLAAAWAGLSVVATAVAFAAGAAQTRASAFHALAGCLVVLAVAGGATRFVAVAWPDWILLLAAAAVAATTVLAAAAARLLPPGARPGPAAGAAVVTGVLAAALLVVTLVAAVEAAATSLPMWDADLGTTASFDWQLLAALGLLIISMIAAVVALALPQGARLDAVTVGAVLVTLALPGAVELVWWAPSVVDLAAATALSVLAVVTRSNRAAVVRGLGGAVLTVNAGVLSLARPENTAAILGATAALALAIAAMSRSGRANPSTVEGIAAARRVLGGSATYVALVAIPPTVGSMLVAVDAASWWIGRCTAAAVGLVLIGLFAVRRAWPAFTWYAYAAAVVSAVVWPTVVAVSGVEPMGVYAGIGLLGLAAAVLAITTSTQPDRDSATNRLAVGATVGGLAALPAALLLAIDVLPAVLSVIALPYSWFGAIWSGVPTGLGLAPPGGLVERVDVTADDAIALGLLAVVSAITAYTVRRRLSSALGGLAVGGPMAILVGLTASAAPWPTVPGATLALGLCITAAAAIVRMGAWRATLATTQGVLYIGAGLAGALTVEWATIAGFAAVAVTSVAVGAAGRSQGWRVGGWIAAVTASLATTAAAGLAADLRPRAVSFYLLGVAAAWLAIGAWLRGRRGVEASAAQSRIEANAVEAAAHAGSLVALLFTVGSSGHAAAVSTLWGVAVGLRALRPGSSRPGRAALAAVAAAWELLAWWLLLAERDVALIEAYTLPLAAVALFAGWAALRARPDLGSWVAYGPALCAAFLPSLATILVASGPAAGSPWRRLLLGVGAMFVVVAGSVRRRQAPVVVGGLALGVVALHELVLVWDLLPRWIPLAAGGLLLVGIAMTYERRRRDLARLREAVGQMR